MGVEGASHNSRITGRALPLFIFLICSLLLFEPPFFAFNSTSRRFQVITLVVLPLLFSTIAVLARRRSRFMIWGYLMQKTGALWGSVLFHAGANTLLIIGIFAGVKT